MTPFPISRYRAALMPALHSILRVRIELGRQIARVRWLPRLRRVASPRAGMAGLRWTTDRWIANHPAHRLQRRHRSRCDRQFERPRQAGGNTPYPITELPLG